MTEEEKYVLACRSVTIVSLLILLVVVLTACATVPVVESSPFANLDTIPGQRASCTLPLEEGECYGKVITW